MAHRGSQAAKESAARRSEYADGVSDARLGRPARYSASQYQRGYRAEAKRALARRLANERRIEAERAPRGRLSPLAA